MRPLAFSVAVLFLFVVTTPALGVPSSFAFAPGTFIVADGDADHGGDTAPSHGGLGHFVRWVGHFHPAMTVFPIALALSAALAEALRRVPIFTRAPWLEGAARFCVIVAAVGGVVTAPLGW